MSEQLASAERLFDLSASAERCRVKASHCEQLASEAVSPLFADCFRELARLMVSTAEMDEDFVRRDCAMKQFAAACSELVWHQAAASKTP
jgi:hypothetical protein